MRSRIWPLVLGLTGLIVSAAVPSHAQEQAGVTAAVRGRVEVALRAGAVGRQVKSGEPVYLGNAVTSGADSGMQIVLLDETTFTIGPNSQLTIDEFVYDPRRSAGKVTASVAKGVFRFVTGKVARENPEAMQVRLPTGVIGIRGTIAIGKVDQVEQNGQMVNRQQVILVGPGYDTDANRRGGIDLIFNGQRITIWRPGYGSTLIGGGQWGPIEQFPPALVQQVLRELQTRGDQIGNPNPTNIQNGGDNLFDGRRIVSWYNGTQQGLSFGEEISDQASLPDRMELTNFQPSAMTPMMAGILDGIATFNDLRTVPTGQFNFNQTGTSALTPSSAGSLGLAATSVGSYSLFLNIDFGARTVGGGDSRVTLNTPVAGGTSYLGTQAFGTGSNPAIFSYSNLSGIIGTGCGSSMTCTANLTGTAINQGGTAGAQLLHALTVLDDGGALVLSGTGLAGRSSGLTVDPVPFTSGISTFEQLRTLSSGQFYYAQAGSALMDSANTTQGTYNLFMNINFGARTIGGGNSRAEITISDYSINNAQAAFASQSFASGSGSVNFTFNSSFAGCGGSCSVQLLAQTLNQNSVLARSLAHQITVTDGMAINTFTGSGTTSGRVPGTAPGS